MILSHRPHIGIILGWFPGRYTRPKTGIFSRSQYELSHLQNFVLRHIGRMAPLRSRDCPISRHPLTFTHGEISQKIFPKNFGLLRKSPRTHPQNSHRSAGIRRTRQNPLKTRSKPAQNPLKTRSKPLLCYIPKKFFQKIFSKFFPKIFRGIFDRGIFDRGIFDRGIFDRGIFDRGIFDRVSGACVENALY